MNYSTLTRRFSHPGIWGNEKATQSTVHSANLHQQLWVTLSTMRKRDDQWVTVIGKAPKTLIAQLIAAGIRPDQIRRVNTSDQTTALWATEQALLINNSQLVIAWLKPCEGRERQRLQLAAKASQALSFIFDSSEKQNAVH